MNKSVFRILCAFILTAGNLSFAQISTGGIPYSFENIVRNDIQIVSLPAVDVEALLAEDEIADKDEPLRFGYPHSVSLDLNNSGTWQDLPDRTKLWRLQINCPGATSINLIYDDFHLPPGGELYIYNDDLTSVYGAFTENNNKAHREFSTTPTSGATTYLEYHHPSENISDVSISISNVIHGYRDVFALMTRNFGDSGGCNNNVNCPEGVPWEEEIRSAAMILSSGGFRLCSGAMVNNVRQDLTPYFLTANHCLGGESTWIIMFNYQSPTCANTDGPTNFTVQGTTLLANRAQSDFALLLLQETPPESYNVHFAGWSAIDTAPQEPVSIHHPSGDIKKITFDYDQGISDGWTNNDGSHWRIATWEDGTTEPGSSGSPLFDQNHRIVGQLHGGEANCSNNVNDYYGKVSMSWDAGSSASSRLSDWLDPDNTGTMVLDGMDAIDLPDPELSYSSEELSLVLNTGMTETSSISVSNIGEDESILYYNLAATPFENPGASNDDFGHFWADSNNEPSLNSQWIDISNEGELISFTHNDQAAPPIDIGFEFPFYNEVYTQCIINPNGWVGFSGDNPAWDNSIIPSPSAPGPAIFGYWDDLNPLNSGNGNGGGQVFFHSNGERLVIWFDNVIHWPVNYDGTYNFQFVLFADGSIQLNYAEMTGDIDSATIGIQNDDGSDGVLISYNAEFVENDYTLEIQAAPQWLIIEDAPGFDGALGQGETAVHPVIFDASNIFESGVFTANIILSAGSQESVIFPIQMIVNEDGILGDLNQDGQVNVQDIILCVNFIIGGVEPEGYQLWAGDLNADGIINVLDVIAIINIILE
jgi:hypothetical protein